MEYWTTAVTISGLEASQSFNTFEQMKVLLLTWMIFSRFTSTSSSVQVRVCVCVCAEVTVLLCICANTSPKF